MTDNPASRELGYCPCCGYKTLAAAPPGSRAVCDVCNWVDDGEQFEDPECTTTTNDVCLEKARENFREYGACQPDPQPETDDPEGIERDPNWPY